MLSWFSVPTNGFEPIIPGLMQESVDEIRSNALVDMVLYNKDPARLCDASLRVKWMPKAMAIWKVSSFLS